MRFAKYVAALTLAVLACVSYSKAQTPQLVFVGGGPRNLFLEVGQAAAAYENQHNTNGGCVYTYNKNTADWSAKDNRPSVYGLPPDVQEGKIWIVYGTGTGGGSCSAPLGYYDIYIYMSLDSVLATRCFFEVDTTGNVPGCIQVATPSAAEAQPSAPPNLLASGSCSPYSQANFCDIAEAGISLPAEISTALNGVHWNAAGTDVRPEDAKFASYRMLQTCGTAVWRQAFDQGLRQVYGLGYQTAHVGIGQTIQESTISGSSGATYSVLDFSIAGGNDPINTAYTTYKSSPNFNAPSGSNQYSVTPIGAQPIIVAVGPAGSGSVFANVTDAPGSTLALFYEGTSGRTTDFVGASVAQPVTTLVREPLSGTYNIFEFSIPNSSQFHWSQDDNNCANTNPPTVLSNPMDLGSANGQQTGSGGQGWKGNGYSYRERLIGTDDMVAALQDASSGDNRLGYFFWSAANGKAFTSTNGKYLTVNGVDPLFATYASNPVAPGVIPTGPNTSLITFANLQAGDYPVWSPLRLITNSASNTGLSYITSGLATVNPTQYDYVPISNLTVWHSHYYLPAISLYVGANGWPALNVPNYNGAGTATLCPVPVVDGGPALIEYGGDAGGSNIYTQVNYDFCVDYGSLVGIINKNN
jgi:hypothetical protein